MAKSVALAVRLPLGVYEKVKEAVDERGMATSYSDFCRQAITERLIDITSLSEETPIEASDLDE